MLESDAQSGGRCRKAMLRVEGGAGKQCSEWREVPESDAWSGGRCRKAMLRVEGGAGKQCSECATKGYVGASEMPVKQHAV